MPTGPKPLDGFRVLDFTQNVAGPLAGQVLADLGAEVIKVEAPAGDASRHITSVLPGRPPLAVYFLPNNRGKKSVQVDLSTPEARQQILRLADTADVVLEGFRPGVDLMVQAEAGMQTGMPTPNGKPQIIPFQLVDNASGHVLAQAVLAALLNRERHGVADVVRVAMYDVAVALQANQLTVHLNRATADRPTAAPARRRKGVGFASQPSDAFRTADGWVVISAYVPKHWVTFCRTIDRPELIDDDRFADQRSRSINYAELTEELEATLTTATSAEWVAKLQRVGIMACLVNTWKQVVDTELFVENQWALPIGDGDAAVTVVRTPARYGSFTAAATDPPPAPGQHNGELLT